MVSSPALCVCIFEGVQSEAEAVVPSPSPPLDEELDLPPQPASRASPRARTETMARGDLRIKAGDEESGSRSGPSYAICAAGTSPAARRARRGRAAAQCSLLSAQRLWERPRPADVTTATAADPGGGAAARRPTDVREQAR